MKAFTVAAIIGGLLLAGPVFAQQAPTPAPAQPAAQAAPAAQAPVVKFPEGARYAFINIQQIAAESADGKASSARIEALRGKKAAELNEKNKSIETNQAKLRSAVMSEDARAQVQKDIDKTQVEIQRMTQDAQAELQELQNELTMDFQRKLGPVIQAVSREKGLLLLFSQGDSGLVWADPGLDLTGEVIRRFDAAAAAPKK
jgi:Skp family chaperone for outer membrane proteins